MALDHAELAWAAGFFDGEGSTFLNNRGARGRRWRPTVRLGIGQTDVRPLERFKAAVGGLGTVRGPYGPYQTSSYVMRTPRWQWDVQGIELTQAIIAMLWKWLSPPKREQAARALSAINEQLDGWVDFRPLSLRHRKVPPT